MNIPVSTLEAIYRRLSRQHYSCSSERANSPGDDASSAGWKFEIMKPASVLATVFRSIMLILHPFQPFGPSEKSFENEHTEIDNSPRSCDDRIDLSRVRKFKTMFFAKMIQC